MTSSPLVLFDASWLAHRAKWAMRGISGQGTEIIFGFLEQLRATCLNPKVRSNHTAIFFDSRHSLRRQIFPAYKAKRRDKSPEELVESKLMADQVKRLRKEILPSIGFPCYQQAGLESDDLMAEVALNWPGRGVVITADEDLLQCISETVHWYDPSRDKYLDLGLMIQKKRVNPGDWVAVKCMAGCHTDGIPGIPGIGEKSATDFLWRLLKGKKLDAINSHEGLAIAKRNHDLIRLPHQLTKPIVVADPKYDPDALFRWGEKLGFQSYFEPRRRQAWEAFFRGEMASADRMPVRKRK